MKYKIELTSLTDKDIADINNFVKTYSTSKLVIRLKNTKGVSTESLLKIVDSPNIEYRVAGGYDEEREQRTNNVEYYEKKNYYTRNELIEIIAIFEMFEKKIAEKKLNGIELAYFVYNGLKKFIRFSTNYFKVNPKSDSLLAIVYRKTSSYGYALVYKEMMDRVGIKCEFVEGNNSEYAWNLLCVNNRYCCIDLAYDSYLYHNGCSNTNMFFGKYDKKAFSSKHKPIPEEKIQDYVLEVDNLNDEELANIMKEKDASERVYVANRYVRDNKSTFILSLIDVIEREPYNLYKYIYYEYIADGRTIKPRIIITEENFYGNENRKEELSTEIKELENQTNKTKEITDKESSLKKEYSLIREYDHYIINEFLTDNYIDSIGDSSYIGYFEYDGKNFKNIMVKDLMNYKVKMRRYRRDDGSIFILEEIKVEDELYYYRCYEFYQNTGNENISIESNIVIIDNDVLLIDKKYDKFIANIFFNRRRILKCVKEYGNYMSYCDYGDKIVNDVVDGINNSVYIQSQNKQQIEFKSELFED